MSEITPLQIEQLNLLQALQYDTAAVKEAKAFTGDDVFKMRLLIQQYNRVHTENGVVARTTKAVQESVESLAVLNGEDVD